MGERQTGLLARLTAQQCKQTAQPTVKQLFKRSCFTFHTTNKPVALKRKHWYNSVMKNDFLPSRHGKKHAAHNAQHNLKSRTEWERPQAFKTPDEVAATSDNMRDPLNLSDMDEPKQKNKKQRKSFKEWCKSLSKKQWIIIAIVGVLLLGAAGVGAYYLWFSDKAIPVIHKKAKPKPKPAIPPTSTLTGLPIADESINDRPVTGIMIENSTFARPQAGLNQAGVVFEAIAEGGITRFLTLFQDTQPDYVGPIRSVRPYYLEWAVGFDAAVAHVGGSADALVLIKNWHVKDLDQSFNSAYYTRVKNRFAPHNVYTSIARLNELEAKKGFGKPNYTGFARKKEQPKPAAEITAKTIDFNISSALYSAHYDYDSTTNTYKRSEGGKPHTDERSGAQLAPKVVVALVMSQSIQADNIHYSYGVLGSGTAYVFQDGAVTQATWNKANRESQIVFKDAAGAILKLNPGQTWLSVVGSADKVKYTP